MTQPHLTKLAQSLPATVPFVGPETQERARGQVFTARLGANESAFGPSPRAIAAMQQAAADVWMYGDPESHDLRQALAQHHGISPDHIMLGEGIDGLLGLIVRLYISAGDSAVTSDGAYPTFNYHVAGFGGQLHKVPYKGDHEDPDALVAKARETGAKLAYIANPDNPMGSWHAGDTIARMARDMPADCMLLLDEAYIDLAPDGTAADIAPTTPNVIRLRTFSKAHGMAGARVGYAIAAPDVIAAFNKVRNHFGLGRISQAGALAALQDETWLPHIRDQIAASRAAIGRIAADHGLRALPSATNFVTIDCGQDGDFARRLLQALVAAGIFVRMPMVAPLDRCIRVSCGTPDQIAAFAAALPDALAQASGGGNHG
jgi:histidinol-phosphate aminotransferase